MLVEVILHINFKCIAKNNSGRIIKKVRNYQCINQKYANNGEPFSENNRYYVDSKRRPVFLSNKIK